MVLGTAHGGMFHRHVAPENIRQPQGSDWCVCRRAVLSIRRFAGPANVSVLAFPAIGLFASVVVPRVFSLALNSVSEHHGSFSGILSTAIVGGAVVPVIIGGIGDRVGLRIGLTFLYVTFGFVLSAGFWARPLISNATITLKKACAEAAV